MAVCGRTPNHLAVFWVGPDGGIGGTWWDPNQALGASNATVPIRIGDPATGCARNRFAGAVNLTSNLAVTFGANTVSGSVNANTNGPGNTVLKANNIFAALACTGNNRPRPTPASPTPPAPRPASA